MGRKIPIDRKRKTDKRMDNSRRGIWLRREIRYGIEWLWPHLCPNMDVWWGDKLRMVFNDVWMIDGEVEGDL